MTYPQERREMRIPVVGIEGSLKSPRDVRVLNLSRNGIAFETPHKLTVGDDYFIEVRYKGQVVNFGVNLCWCARKRGTQRTEVPVFVAGGSFVDVLHDKAAGLWSSLLVEGSGLSASSPR